MRILTKPTDFDFFLKWSRKWKKNWLHKLVSHFRIHLFFVSAFFPYFLTWTKKMHEINFSATAQTQYYKLCTLFYTKNTHMHITLQSTEERNYFWNINQIDLLFLGIFIKQPCPCGIIVKCTQKYSRLRPFK